MLSPLCADCSIYQRLGRCHAVPSAVPHSVASPTAPATYMVIGDAPGTEEHRTGTPFVGAAGTLLRESLELAGIRHEEVIYANAVQCWPLPSLNATYGAATIEEARQCLLHAWVEVWNHRPRVIILVGSTTLQAVTGIKGITKWLGRTVRLADVAAELPFAVRYFDFLRWAHACATGALVVDGWEKDAETWRAKFTLREREAAETQMSYAAQRFGWRPFADFDTVLVPVLHPAAVLRSGGSESPQLPALRNSVRVAYDVVYGNEALRDVDYRCLNTIEEIERYVEETIALHHDFKTGNPDGVEVISVDVETSELEDIWAIPFSPKTRLYSVQVSRRQREGVLIFIDHEHAPWYGSPHELRKVRASLERLLHSVPVVGQNYVFDYTTLRCKLGISGYKVVGDTRMADHWNTMGYRLDRDLDALVERNLGVSGHKREAKEWRDRNPGRDFGDMPFDIQIDYACGDTDMTLRLFFHLREELRRDGIWEPVSSLYFGPHDVWRVVSDMHWYGMPYNRDKLAELAKNFPERLSKQMHALYSNPLMLQYHAWRFHRYVEATQKKNCEKVRPKPVLTFEQWAGSWTKKKGMMKAKYLFNPASTKQIQELLFEFMRLPTRLEDLEYTDREETRPKTSAHNVVIFIAFAEAMSRSSRSTLTALGCRDGATIEEVLQIVPLDRHSEAVVAHNAEAQWRIAANLLTVLQEQRRLAKLHSTYVYGIPALTPDPARRDSDPRTRILPIYRPFADLPPSDALHPSIHLDSTVSSRTTSTNPNGQNFPKRKADKKDDVTSPYESPQRHLGGLLLGADYSQIEVRVMVMLAQAADIARAIDQGLDIHRFMASKVYRTEYEKVTKAQRAPTKNITFGILFGQAAMALARVLKISIEEATTLIEAFFQQIPEVKGLIDACHSFAIAHGNVWTLTGRRRHLPDAQSSRRYVVSSALRRSVNTPIQGLASDMLMSAIGRSWVTTRRIEMHLLAHPYLTIHDAQYWNVLGVVIDAMQVIYYQMVYAPYEIWSWVSCRPEAEFDVGASWDLMCEASLHIEDETVDPERLRLRGTPRQIESLLETWRRVSRVDVTDDREHPNEEEAKKGYREIELYIPRQRAFVELRNRKLYAANGESLGWDTMT